ALRPSLGPGRQTATWAQWRDAVIPPLHESRPDAAIVFDLATRLGLGAHFFDGNVQAAQRHELAPSGLTLEHLKAHPRGVRGDAPTRYEKYAEIDPATGRPRGFPTLTRKVEIYSTAFARAGHAALPVYEAPATADGYPLVLTFF